ncbi:MAG: hypothetical protein IJ642_08875 [Oscillospiraceae bacterium]|nr:hypothetical protein [Oscillospiraceae bacterium]
MPAYFSVTLEFSRKNIAPDFMQKFYQVLVSSGLVFKSGYWGSEQDDLQTILQWNQKKLEQDFKIGYSEHFSHDYKQMCFALENFQEVRGFWMNQYPVQDEFTFEIIIPEYEIFGDEVYSKNQAYIPEKMQKIQEIACQIWERFSPVMSIQTELEIIGACVPEQAVLSGQKLPSAYPFAIISEKTAQNNNFIQFRKISLGRNGMLLLSQTN